ncbi:hypothetical protein FRX31_018260 [Thalictrum thalictroides]|uniref:Uncharacterized protein n=1 Tax=Thalictrum thalictroides TaxID=46969 RepID=A0A7J6W443_THATH|nr:hypothetical protein FRX31_018260 [Thalictrum thalictroides]
MALQQLGPKYVSPLIKKRITSPVHARSSIKDSQHLYESSACKRAARVDPDEVIRGGRAAMDSIVNDSNKMRKKHCLDENAMRERESRADVRMEWRKVLLYIEVAWAREIES